MKNQGQGRFQCQWKVTGPCQVSEIMGICSVGQFSAKLSTGVGKDWGEGGQAGSESEPHMHLTRVASLADIEAMGPPLPSWGGSAETVT